MTRDEPAEPRLRGRLSKNDFSVFVSSVGGIFLGGFIVRKFDLKRSLKMAARFCVICQVFTIIGSGAWFIPGCGTPDLAGLLVPYNGGRLEAIIFLYYFLSSGLLVLNFVGI